MFDEPPAAPGSLSPFISALWTHMEQKILYTPKQPARQTGWQRRSSVKALCSFLQRSSSSLDVPLSCNTLWSSARVRREKWDSNHQMDGGCNQKYDSNCQKIQPGKNSAKQTRASSDAETLVWVEAMAKVTFFITSIVQKPACVFNGSQDYSGILIIMWFQGLIPAKSQGSHGNWIWPFRSLWNLQSLKFSSSKTCCWPTSVSSWTNFESWAEFWRTTVFHEKRKKEYHKSKSILN